MTWIFGTFTNVKRWALVAVHCPPLILVGRPMAVGFKLLRRTHVGRCVIVGVGVGVVGVVVGVVVVGGGGGSGGGGGVVGDVGDVVVVGGSGGGGGTGGCTGGSGGSGVLFQFFLIP